ncbi:Alpha-L-rhamnosidase rgxB [Paramyrothecium foliicola]|nr:Alpha-L-rhamnosidase rgxB [Paramyrothecium foliicola]
MIWLLPLISSVWAKTCTIPAQGNGSDDSPAITEAFEKCGCNSKIVFQNTTYHIHTALSFKHLNNWSTDIQYWLKNSLPIGPGEDQESYPPAAWQNQTTAMILGGKKLRVKGHGYGTFDGNGQAWYDFVKGESNYPKRPHALVITAQDSYFSGLRFIQPQMWTVTIVGSKNVVLEDIFVSAVSKNRNPARNTDGANTIFSDNITFRRWEIENGDDCIAAKTNSTNILVEDSIFRHGQGVAIGSIGQYDGRFEIVENVTVRNIQQYGSNYVARIKTWTGETNDYPPNGGGGGIGCLIPIADARNITWENIRIVGAARTPLTINQCYTNVQQVDCNTSKFEIYDITWRNISGTLNTTSSYPDNRYAEFQCSRSQNGCDRLRMSDVSFTFSNETSGQEELASAIRCSNVIAPEGFRC